MNELQVNVGFARNGNLKLLGESFSWHTCSIAVVVGVFFVEDPTPPLHTHLAREEGAGGGEGAWQSGR